MKRSTGINGFGRFALHLLKYWLDRNREAHFGLDYINDDTLTIEQAEEIIQTDTAVAFDTYTVQRIGDRLRFTEPYGAVHDIVYTHAHKDQIPWVGKPDIFLECSGKNTVKRDCLSFLSGQTQVVAISATSWDCDQTLVYGFNHTDYDAARDKIISYGSCTVNAFVPLAKYLHDRYGVVDADVNVIHSIQAYRLSDHNTLARKFCTLQKSARQLLGFLSADNFLVSSTVVPYAGVSMIDFRFRLARCPARKAFVEQFEQAMDGGALQHLYGMDETDRGPQVHNGRSSRRYSSKRTSRS